MIAAKAKGVSLETVTGIYPSGDVFENLLDEALTIVGMLVDHAGEGLTGPALCMLERKLQALAKLYGADVDTPIARVPAPAKAKRRATATKRRKAA